MRKKNYKGRCEKRKLPKCNEVCKTYDAIQYAYADILASCEEVKEIRKKSVYPEDSYLFMVSAIKEDGTFAVWTSWNEKSQSLNYGHYNLQTLEECEKVFEEFYNNGK